MKMCVEKRKNAIKTIQEYFIYFMLYSFIGWCYEVFLEVVIYKWGFSNRGVLFGPYCVVYGFGALLLVFALGKVKNKKIKVGKWNISPVLVFVCIIVITTLVELGASYILEWIKGEWLWDYSRFALDFQGRIAPNPSIRFGIGGMVFLYVLQPLFCRITHAMSKKVLLVVSSSLGWILAIDVIVMLLSYHP